MIRIAAAASASKKYNDLIDQLLTDCAFQLNNEKPNLGVLFFTSHYMDDVKRNLAKIYHDTQVDFLIGCSAYGVVGPQQEFENEPAISLWLGSLPGAIIQPFHIHQERMESFQSDADWRRAFSVEPGVDTSMLLLGDPFSLRIDQVLNGINQAIPGCPVVGGMASSAKSPGQNVLIVNDQWYNDGGVGVSICGDIVVESVISQGCRPIGQPLMITKGERNVIQELGGKPAFLALNELYNQLPPNERDLVDQGIFVGRVIDEYKQEFKRGDFLIRNIVGVDQESYSIAVLDQVRPGTTIQFHVRDAESADDDLHAMLGSYHSLETSGALLFSCNGRGTQMYSEPNHDLNVLKDKLGAPPISGFFCAGELGPVGGQNFIHGHTASIALFRKGD